MNKFVLHFVGWMSWVCVFIANARPIAYKVIEVSSYDLVCPDVGTLLQYERSNSSLDIYFYDDDILGEWRLGVPFRSMAVGQFGDYGGSNLYSSVRSEWNNVLYLNNDWILDFDSWVRVLPVWGNSICGRVVYRGLPISGADIRVHRDNGFWLEQMGNDVCLSDSDGHYCFESLPDGDYWVSCSFVSSDSYNFARPWTGGLVHVSGVVSNVDFAVDGDYTFSGRLYGYWDIPATNVYCEVFRRSVDKSFTDLILPPGVTPADLVDPDFDTSGVIWSEQVEDGAWWWSVTPSDYLVADTNGVFSISGLESGWYIFNFYGGNLVTNNEFEVYIDSDETFNKRIDLQNVSFESPPYGGIVITSFSRFKAGSVNEVKLGVRDNYQARRNWRFMVSSNLVDWISLITVNGPIHVGTPMRESVIRSIPLSEPWASSDRLFFKVIMNDLQNPPPILLDKK